MRLAVGTIQGMINSKGYLQMLNGFKEEVLGYYDEPNPSLRNTLHEFCKILNQNISMLFRDYTVDSFKAKSQYHTLARRYINRKRNMWLYFVSCTDSTHAPRGFLETETLLFYYKGFVAELCFQQDAKDRWFFKLNDIIINKKEVLDKEGLTKRLEQTGIDPHHYYKMLQAALNRMHSNYYFL